MKKKLDFNQLAKSVVEQATGETVPEKDDEQKKTAQEKERFESEKKIKKDRAKKPR
jgi:hypothetical protein